jgi:hypothetical protein
MSSAGILEAGVVIGTIGIRGAILTAEGAALGAAGLALGTAAAARQWRNEAARLRTCREAEVLRQLVLAEVTARNARLAALRRLSTDTDAAGSGPVPAIPEPLDPGGTETVELIAWCKRLDPMLEAAEAALAERLTASLIASLARQRGAAGARLRRAAEHAAVAGAPASAAPGSGADVAGADVEQSLVRLLRRLLPDTSAEDRRSVAAAADRALAAPTAGEARTCLDEVRVRVQSANERAARRRTDAVEAARMLHAISAGAELGGELTAVIEGRRDLDLGLRARAAAAVEAADADADQRYLSEAMVAILAELGYDVEEGFATGTAGEGVLRVRHQDWEQHAVHLRVDGERRQVRSALVRTAAGADAAADGQADQASAETWCAALETARERLEDAGVRTRVEELTPPGSRVVPLVGVAERRRRQATARRHERGRP